MLTLYVNRHGSWLGATEDIVQETLLSVHKSLHTYRAGSPVRPWACAIARRRIADFAHACFKYKDYDLKPDGFSDDLSGGSWEDSLQDQHLVHKALSSLPKKYRDVTLMMRLQGFSVAEVSQKTGLSESAVKACNSRGGKLLKKKILALLSHNFL